MLFSVFYFFVADIYHFDDNISTHTCVYMYNMYICDTFFVN